MLNNPSIIWLIIFIIMVVAELMTMGLVTIWFAGGALVALLLSFTSAGPVVQVIVCIVVSIALMALIRPWSKKHFNQGREATNAQSLIGKNAVVIEDIDNLKAQGRVMVQGMEWTARSENEDEQISAGETVVIREIQGVKLIVAKK